VETRITASPVEAARGFRNNCFPVVETLSNEHDGVNAKFSRRIRN